MYPIRVNDPEVIAKSTNEQVKNLSKSNIDKIQCYAALSHVFVLSDEKLYYFDSALREPKQIAVKVILMGVRCMISRLMKGQEREKMGFMPL
jgi:hypothetical protein